MKTVTILLLIIISISAFGTVQQSEKLIYKTDTIYFDGDPLEHIMKTNPTIKNRIKNYADTICGGSDCWRGYIGTWEIKNDSLFLIHLTSCCYDYTFNLKKVFTKRKNRNGKVFSNWFSGEIKTYYNRVLVKEGNKELYVFTKSFSAIIRKGKIISVLIEPAHEYSMGEYDQKTESFEELEHLDNKK